MNATLEIPVPTTKPTMAMPAKRKILLVDDDPAVRKILFQLLVDEDYFVLSAANGPEALELAESTELDLVLLDLDKPERDGWQAYERLSESHPQLPIILITSQPDHLLKAMASAVNALLKKPLNLVKLFQTIHSILSDTAGTCSAFCSAEEFPIFQTASDCLSAPPTIFSPPSDSKPGASSMTTNIGVRFAPISRMELGIRPLSTKSSLSSTVDFRAFLTVAHLPTTTPGEL